MYFWSRILFSICALFNYLIGGWIKKAQTLIDGHTCVHQSLFRLGCSDCLACYFIWTRLSPHSVQKFSFWLFWVPQLGQTLILLVAFSDADAAARMARFSSGDGVFVPHFGQNLPCFSGSGIEYPHWSHRCAKSMTVPSSRISFMVFFSLVSWIETLDII